MEKYFVKSVGTLNRIVKARNEKVYSCIQNREGQYQSKKRRTQSFSQTTRYFLPKEIIFQAFKNPQKLRKRGCVS